MYCCYFEKIAGHCNHKKNLRPVIKVMTSQNNSLVKGTNIYDSCRKKLQRYLMLQTGIHLSKRRNFDWAYMMMMMFMIMLDQEL